MGKAIVVTSGKGGVGKTTSTAAIGAALAKRNEKVVVVDFDVGLRNLDLVMGAERRVVFDLINVIQGEAKLSQALIRVADQGQGQADTGGGRARDQLPQEGLRLGHLRQSRWYRARGDAGDAPRRCRDRGDQSGSLVGP